MSEKRFEVLFYGDVINCVRDETGKEYNLHELIKLLMDQQATIKKLQKELNDCEKFRYQVFKRMGELYNEWYNRINHNRFNVSWITVLYSEMVRMTEDKDKEIRKLELEIRRLQMVIRLQEDIIDSYRELSRLKGSKLVVE